MSIKRINEFLKNDDLDPTAVTHDDSAGRYQVAVTVCSKDYHLVRYTCVIRRLILFQTFVDADRRNRNYSYEVE